MEKLKLDRRNLRKFGITMGVAFLAIGIFVLSKHKHTPFVVISISAGFFITAFIAPLFLKPVYILWMRIALILSWVNTRLILFIIFYFIFTPIGLILKLFNMDLLNRKIDKDIQSYWVKKEKKDFMATHYERQF